jgi:hypothetical protein
MRQHVQGTVYLLHFLEPIGNPANPRAMAQHYIGKPASSGLLQPGLCAGSRELLGTGPRWGLSAPPRRRGRTQTGSAVPTGSW